MHEKCVKEKNLLYYIWHTLYSIVQSVINTQNPERECPNDEQTKKLKNMLQTKHMAFVNKRDSTLSQSIRFHPFKSFCEPKKIREKQRIYTRLTLQSTHLAAFHRTM